MRAYDADNMCIYDLGDVCDGTDLERLLERALADCRTDMSISTLHDRAAFCPAIRLRPALGNGAQEAGLD